ncbi:hypothetical protein FQN49_001218 [Arthroderma sp. PD_2]|nr:hypothetical protein FQN49_001218 [Arthroderma sp. PD_2]
MAKRSWEDSTPETSELNHTSSPATMVSTSPPSSRHKYPHMDKTAVSEGGDASLMRCSLPPHKGELSFPTYEEYESHYMQTHVNRCSECRKNFPSDLFLTRHIEENHDPVMEERKERGEKTFGCFVEGCDRRCSTPQKRRLHLIDKHCFPRGYNFYIVNDGIDKYSSMLRSSMTMHRRRFSLETGSINSKSNAISSPPTTPQRRRNYSIANRDQEVSPTQKSKGTETVHAGQIDRGKIGVKDDDLAGLTQSMSALRFVPHSVTMRRQQKDKS